MNARRPSAARLYLQLVSSQGQAACVRFALNPGCPLRLDHVLASAPTPVPEDQIAAASSCRIVDHGVQPNGDVLWWMENSSDDLVCQVGGHRLAQGVRVRLNEGDTLDIGLNQFLIATDATPLTASISPSLDTLPSPVFGAATAHGAIDSANAATVVSTHAARPDAYPNFALTDLAALMPTEHLASTLGLFNAVARPHTDADPTPSLPWMNVRGTPLTDLTGRPNDAALNSAANVSSEWLGNTVDPATELVRLHGDYLRLMRDPTDTQVLSDWGTSTAPRTFRHDVLEDLTRSASGYDSLHELLGETSSIEVVMTSLDALLPQNILEPEPSVNVLRLFAPTHMGEQGQALSALTRQEHHMLSADSAAGFEPRQHEAHLPSTSPIGPASDPGPTVG